MTEPARIYSLDEARKRAELAIAKVDMAMHENWREEAKWAVRAVAKRQPHFITDQVWDLLAETVPEVQTHENRAMGPIMRWAVSEGLVRRTAITQKGRRKAANQTPMPVYESLIWTG